MTHSTYAAILICFVPALLGLLLGTYTTAALASPLLGATVALIATLLQPKSYGPAPLWAVLLALVGIASYIGGIGWALWTILP